MNDTLSPLEIATVVSSFFGIAYVFVRAGTVPRQVWRGPVAAFGSGILSLGIAGMTDAFYQGLSANEGGSRATRELVFAELMSSAWRPGFIAALGLVAFIATVWSSSSGDDDRAESYGGALSILMVLGAALSLVGMAAYVVGFFTHDDPTQATALMVTTKWTSISTVAICLIGGLWTAFQGNSWSAEEA